MTSSVLPTVASLWIGSELSWIERACLSSFVDVGNPVILYSYQPIKNLPEGVKNADAAEIWQVPDRIMKNTAPSYVADIFRVYLMKNTDYIWVDTDVLALMPLAPNESGFLVGYTPWNAEINNCIMRLPKESQTLSRYLNIVNDLSIVPPWMRPALRQRLEKIPEKERDVVRFHTLRTILGPRALTHFLKETGEDRHALPAESLSPVPWQMVDVLFNPHGGWEGWFSEHTKAVHLWSNVLRHHKNHTLSPESFVGQRLQSLGLSGP